jgi:hypothetical protein
MSVDWPDSLVSEIAERRSTIFMGAGASMASRGVDGTTQPPGWLSLLEGALPLVHKDADKRYAKKLLKAARFLDAAEVIRESSSAADFTAYLQTKLAEPNFQPSEFHRYILEIDPKVLITTNYDEIYDHYCVSGSASAGYRIIKYTDGTLVENLRSKLRLVVKAHGCLSNPGKLVLTRSSYYKAKRDFPGFYAVLDALFLTQTILFVGCSLTDPDIQLVLENANISAPSDHPHYALIEKLPHPVMRDALKTMHNIEVIEYPSKRHDLAIEALRDLRDLVISRRSI